MDKKQLINLVIISYLVSLAAINTVFARDLNKDDFFLEKRGKFDYPLFETDVLEMQYRRELNKNKKINDQLGLIKFYIINGNLEKAKLMLLQNDSQNNFSQIIKYRYLSIIHFINGQYNKSIDYLNKKEMTNIGYTKNLCLMRTLNYLVLERNQEAAKEWSKCIDATLAKSPTEHIWMTTLVNLKSNKKDGATKIPFKSINIENESGDYLRLFLKLSLYLGEQTKILDRIKFLDKSVYQDPQIRELIGMLYYREGEIRKAYNFIEDLQSPNSQNIKGNIYLTQNKYELAYAQFKLALKKKINSQNSIERMIPLSWLLNQWDDGLAYLDKLKIKKADKYTRRTLTAAFTTQNKAYKKALRQLETIVYSSKNAQSPEVNQLLSFNSIMLKDKQRTLNYSNLSCKNYDGINCWLRFHLQTWEDFTYTIHRKEKIHDMNMVSQYLEDSEELEEELFINQKDIEELDNNLITLSNTEN